MFLYFTVLISTRGLFFSCNFQDGVDKNGLIASVRQVGVSGFGGVSPNPRDDGGGFKLPYADLCVKYVEGIRAFGAAADEEEKVKKSKKKNGLKLKIKVANPSLRRLISGAIAGAVSRTAVAPLETIRTHLMVGSSGHSTTEVFHEIMRTDGWKGLFRGNFVNVVRVAPSKAIEVMNSEPFSCCLHYFDDYVFDDFG